MYRSSLRIMADILQYATVDMFNDVYLNNSIVLYV